MATEIITGPPAGEKAVVQDAFPHSTNDTPPPPPAKEAASTSSSTDDAKNAADGEAQPAGPRAQSWNEPRRNMFRFFAALWAFVVLGAGDGGTGALIPYVEAYYDITYTVVATLFLLPVIGYSMAALVVNQVHVRFGQQGVSVLAPACKIVGFAVAAAHPPFPAFAVLYVFTGVGAGLEDGAWNAWVGGLAKTNELMGILHGAYGLGAAIGPLVSTAMITKRGLQWYTWFYVLIGCAFLELVVGFVAFRGATGSHFRAANSVQNREESVTKEALRKPLTWVISLFLFAYVGVEVALGGWIVTFMLENRGGEPFASGMVATGFWLGLTAGRVVLGFVTGRVGEKLAIVAYLALSVALELLFWLIPSFVSSAVFVAFLGFFLGPLFPAAIVVATKLLPRRLHVTTVSLVAALGSSGAAVMPFAVGAIAQAKGVGVLQPIALALIVVILLLWCSLPGGFKRNGLDLVEAKMLEEESQPPDPSRTESPQV